MTTLGLRSILLASPSKSAACCHSPPFSQALMAELYLTGWYGSHDLARCLHRANWCAGETLGLMNRHKLQASDFQLLQTWDLELDWTLNPKPKSQTARPLPANWQPKHVTTLAWSSSSTSSSSRSIANSHCSPAQVWGSHLSAVSKRVYERVVICWA